MIEKNIRLQPHHARDLLVGRRSDGRRPGYQPPGRGGSGGGPPSQGGGSPSGGGGGGGGGPPGGGDRQMTYTAPPVAYRPPPKDVMPVYVPPPKVEAPIHHHQDTIKDVIQQEILDEIREEEKERFDADWEFQDIKAKAPTTFEPKTKTYEKHVPFTDDPVEIITQMQSPTYYQDRSKIGGETWGERAEAGIKRGSGILGTLGKVALTGLTAGAGAGLFGKDIASLAKAAKWAKRGQALKETGKINILGKDFDVSNLTSTIDKAADRRSRPKGMPEHLGERGFKTRRETPEGGEGGDGIPTAITGEKGLLTEGAETLGITDEQRKQYLLMQNKMKMALDQGSYTNEQGQVIQLNEQQLDQLQKYIDNLNNILGTVLQTAAHGGRIDHPLTGGNRYI